MGLLTEQEKKKIRDEVLFREEVRHEISEAKSSREQRWYVTWWRAVWAFANSSFVLSCLVAVILALLTQRWQEDAQIREQQRTRSIALRDKKHQAATRFLGEHYTFELVYSDLREANRFLERFDKKGGPVVFKSSKEDMYELVYKLREDYKRQMPKFAAAMSDVELLFSDPKIAKATDEMLLIQASIMASKDHAQMQRLTDYMDLKVKLLQNLMRKEIFEKPTAS